MMNEFQSVNMQQMNRLQASMQAMLSAHSALDRAELQGNVSRAMNGRANVLEAEIQSGNGNIEAKKKALSKLQEDMNGVNASQAETLGDAKDAMDAAMNTDRCESEGSSLLTETELSENSKTDDTREAEADPKKQQADAVPSLGDCIYTNTGALAAPQSEPARLCVSV